MKTPSDFGIDPCGARNGNNIYGTKWISYYDAEEYIEDCRTRFAEDVCKVPPLPKWDGATQQFLVACAQAFDNGGDEALAKLFSDFADYVITHLPLYKAIDSWRDYNSRVIAYNDYVCEQSEGKLSHRVSHPDYYYELLNWFPSNWHTYWEWCGSDCQRCGGNFRRTYAGKMGREKWGERYDYFVNDLAKIFVDKINEAKSKRTNPCPSGSRANLAIKTEQKHNKVMTTDELKNLLGSVDIAQITFTKKNGEERVMNASRNWDFLRSESEELGYTDPVNEPNYDCEARGMVRVWDCDECGWRTIICANITNVDVLA